MTRIAVTGSRKCRARASVYKALERALSEHPDFHLVVGYDPKDQKFQGLDEIAAQWAMERGVPLTCYPADWARYGNPAGPIRNRLMAISGLKKCIAFPGGKGTANMIEQCEKAGVPVERV